jgi:GNAT superfamily N-acetyltransferase
MNAPVIRSADSTDPAAAPSSGSLHEFNSATTGFHKDLGPTCFIHDADGRWEGVGRPLVEAAIDEARARGVRHGDRRHLLVPGPRLPRDPEVRRGGTHDGHPGHDEIVYRMRLDGCPE